MEQLSALLAYPFLQNALWAALFASIACGIVGTLVICNRLTFLAGGASHAAYGGIGLSFHFGWPLLPCTLVFSLLASLLMGGIMLRGEARESRCGTSPDVAIGVLWAAGMAFGIILIELTPGYAGELMGFLFGSILAVPAADIAAMGLFNLLLLATLVLFGQGIYAVSLDKDFSRARGLPVRALSLLIIGLTAVAVVMLIRVVGLILVLALLTIPPHLARRFCKGLYGTMACASLLALAFCLAGLAVSWHTDLSSGASIIALAALTYFLLSLPLAAIGRLTATAAPACLALCLLAAPATARTGLDTPATPAVRGLAADSVPAIPAPGAPAAVTSVPVLAGPADASAPLPRTTAEKGIYSPFGKKRGKTVHKGIDIPAPSGSPVRAFLGGEVTFSGRKRGYGVCVVIRQDDGMEALYAHMKSTPLKTGQRVAAGGPVGTIGRTGRASGNHLHFELKQNGRHIDPAPFLVHAAEIVPQAKMGQKSPQILAAADQNAAQRTSGVAVSGAHLFASAPPTDEKGRPLPFRPSFASTFRWTPLPAAEALP